jgi:hypothetical protein
MTTAQRSWTRKNVQLENLTCKACEKVAGRAGGGVLHGLVSKRRTGVEGSRRAHQRAGIDGL